MLNSDNIHTMDSHVMLSIVNMKLRNDFTSLPRLCRFYDISQAQLEARLTKAGFSYQVSLNQFRAL